MINKAIKEIKEDNPQLTWVGVAEIINDKFDLELTGNACRKRLKRFNKHSSKKATVADVDYPTIVNNFVITDTNVVESVLDDDLDFSDAMGDLIRATGMNLDLVEVKAGKVWGSADKLNASFAWKRKSIPSYSKVDALIKQLSIPDSKHTPFREIDGELAIVSVYDVHLQKLSINGEGLHETKVNYKKTILALADKIKRCDITQIVVPLGNDFGNTDNVQNLTTAGTPQQNNVTWQLGIDEVSELAIWAITELSKIAKVHVIMVGGNHDRMSTYFLGKFVSAWFRSNVNISIDNSHNSRKYYQYGENCFMFTHGNEEKIKDFASLMAIESGTMWATSKFREVHLGHLHKRANMFHHLTEDKGIYIRYMPSISLTDDWHARKGYVGNLRTGIASVYDKKFGLVSEFYSIL